jgi:hypothetical protein
MQTVASDLRWSKAPPLKGRRHAPAQFGSVERRVQLAPVIEHADAADIVAAVL